MKHVRRFSIALALAASILAPATAGAAATAAPSCPATVAPPQGSVRACSPGHLADVLNSDFRGRIIIPRDVFWEMRGHTGEPLRDLPVKSGGGPRAMAVSFSGDRLAQWSGLGSGNQSFIRSSHDMR